MKRICMTLTLVVPAVSTFLASTQGGQPDLYDRTVAPSGRQIPLGPGPVIHREAQSSGLFPILVLSLIGVLGIVLVVHMLTSMRRRETYQVGPSEEAAHPPIPLAPGPVIHREAQSSGLVPILVLALIGVLGLVLVVHLLTSMRRRERYQVV